MSENKAVLTKEVAEALEKARAWGYTANKILEITFQKGWISKKYEPLNDIDPMVLAKALINGYEVEHTPYDRLVEYYKSWCGSGLEWHEGVKTGIEGTLKILSEQYPELRKLLNELIEMKGRCRV